MTAHEFGGARIHDVAGGGDAAQVEMTGGFHCAAVLAGPDAAHRDLKAPYGGADAAGGGAAFGDQLAHPFRIAGFPVPLFSDVVFPAPVCGGVTEVDVETALSQGFQKIETMIDSN
jgi:hypothetical protein